MATRKTPSSSSNDSPTVLNKVGVRALLTSGMIDGFTPGIANRLIDRFGPGALDAVGTSHPDAKILLGDRWDRAKEALENVREDWVLLAWLMENDARPGFAQRAVAFRQDIENTGPKTVMAFLEAVRANPYLLAQASGIGFAQADHFALTLGFEPEGEQRLLACATNAVQKACEDAGGGANRGQVLRVLQEFVAGKGAVSPSQVGALTHQSFDLGLSRKVLKQGMSEKGETVVFSTQFYEAEEACALKLLRMSEDPSPYAKMDMEAALVKAQDEVKLTLRAKQREAINILLQGRVAILEGKPGSGKTTLLRCVAPFLESDNRKVLYAAPTGKAAKRMSQAMGRPAGTIHRLLGLGKKGGPSIDMVKNLREADAIVLDEASMIDVSLLRHVLGAMGPKTLLLLVGDPGQLPSVGAGKALADLIASRAFPTARLTEVVRQAEDSAIVSVSRSIDEGVLPEFRLTSTSTADERAADCLFLEEDNAERVGQRIVQLLRSAQAKSGMDPLREAQVIVASHKGAAGVAALNQTLQAAFNPPSNTTPELRVEKIFNGVDTSFSLRLGDKVMQTKNDVERPLYDDMPKVKKTRAKKTSNPAETNDGVSSGDIRNGAAVPSLKDRPSAKEELGVFNGDVGFIERVQKDGTLWVKFDDGYAEIEPESARKSLTLAYANTVHKFQGSESRLILFALHKSTPMPLLTRNLVYTAITRAKKKCLVIGSYATLERATRVDALALRTTRLKGLIDGSLEPENLPDSMRGIYERKALRRSAEKIEQVMLEEAMIAGTPLDAVVPQAPKRRRL